MTLKELYDALIWNAVAGTRPYVMLPGEWYIYRPSATSLSRSTSNLKGTIKAMDSQLRGLEAVHEIIKKVPFFSDNRDKAQIAINHFLGDLERGFIRLDYQKFGAEKNSFDTIVASGVRGSLPHGTASDKKISAGEFVTMDFGAIFGGYCSDMTRTIFVGKASENQKKLYNAVLDAQLHGLEVIKIGKGGKEIDAAVRTKLEQAGLGEYFTHSLGHSLGIEVHEEPRLSKLSTCESLQENMLVTDEPGIYIPKVGGIRIEDTVLVTKNGAEPLTESPKNLIEL